MFLTSIVAVSEAAPLIKPTIHGALPAFPTAEVNVSLAEVHSLVSAGKVNCATLSCEVVISLMIRNQVEPPVFLYSKSIVYCSPISNGVVD